MSGDVSLRWRLAGWLRALPEFRGRDRLGTMILRGAIPPDGTLRVTIGPGLVFDARMREDGSWIDLFFLQYEAPSLAPVLETFLGDGATFVDVGANVGVYTAWGSRCVGSAGRVLAFEPIPALRGHIEHVVGLNALSNVTLVPKALGAERGVVTLWVVPHASGLTSAVAPSDPAAAQRVDVPMTTLDEELAGTQTPPALIKIDVEGYEMAVLQGAARTLASPQGPRRLVRDTGGVPGPGGRHVRGRAGVVRISFRLPAVCATAFRPASDPTGHARAARDEHAGAPPRASPGAVRAAGPVPFPPQPELLTVRRASG
jgi:FkbM family methyltransferase